MSGGPRRRSVALLALAVAVVAAVLILLLRLVVDVASAEPAPPPTPEELQAKAERDKARRYARRLESVVHRQVTRAERNERRLKRARWTFRRALGTSPIGNHWLESAFECIHRYEGSWSDSGDPYWGGLQMDWSFMRAYGAPFLRAFGPANRWPRSVQLAVAIEAWTSRGFGPWPNTRKECGL